MCIQTRATCQEFITLDMYIKFVVLLLSDKYIDISIYNMIVTQSEKEIASISVKYKRRSRG